MHDSVPQDRKLAHAWILLCFALALHVFDEATTGFLRIYNPSVVALRDRFGWWPMPTFEFGEWLAGLIVAVVVLLALTGVVSRGAKGTRALAYIFRIIMLLNAAGHTLATVFGRTVASVTFPGRLRDSGHRQSWRLLRSTCWCDCARRPISPRVTADDSPAASAVVPRFRLKLSIVLNHNNLPGSTGSR